MGTTNNDVLLINSSTLTDIANAIRAKHNVNTKYYPSEMAVQISNIKTSPSPITVNITQSEHQTITVIPSTGFRSKTSSGNYSVPSYLLLNASIEADSGYIAGELNESLVEAYWGDTVTFSATPATEIPIITITLKKATDSAELTNTPSNYSVTLDYYDETGGRVNSNFDLTELNTNDININVYYGTKMYIDIGKGINFLKYNKQFGISYSDEPSDNDGIEVICDSNKTLYVYASST